MTEPKRMWCLPKTKKKSSLFHWHSPSPLGFLLQSDIGSVSFKKFPQGHKERLTFPHPCNVSYVSTRIPDKSAHRRACPTWWIFGTFYISPVPRWTRRRTRRSVIILCVLLRFYAHFAPFVRVWLAILQNWSFLNWKRLKKVRVGRCPIHEGDTRKGADSILPIPQTKKGRMFRLGVLVVGMHFESSLLAGDWQGENRYAETTRRWVFRLGMDRIIFGAALSIGHSRSHHYQREGNSVGG